MSKEMISAYQWQYNGVVEWQDIWDWCRENLKYCWTNNFETIHFDDEKEYLHFMLVWQ